jgi:cytochrome c oxidase subunit 2
MNAAIHQFTANLLAASLPIHPPTASTIGQGVDYLYFFLTGITLFFTILIFSIIFYFMVKYHRRSDDELPGFVGTSAMLEITWTLIPVLICAGIFPLGLAICTSKIREPPNAAMEMFVVGKQWMWQHPASQKVPGKSTNCICRWECR